MPDQLAAGKIAYTIRDAVRISGLSRSMLYLMIARGALRARKCGARTIITDHDLKKFILELPQFTPAGEARHGS